MNVDRFTPEGPASDRINHDGPSILFVGRLVPGKRPMDAVRTISRLPDDLNARLYVVGDGPLQQKLAKQATDAPVELLGHVPYDEMPTIYRASDLLFLTSRVEGMPRAVLEAFPTGTPVVSSDLEQIASTVERGGEAVDASEYETALQRVLEKRDQLGSKAREVARDEFRWCDTVSETTDVLTRLV